jgi:hypothetical protein
MTQIVIGGTHTPYIEALWQIEKEFFSKIQIILPYLSKQNIGQYLNAKVTIILKEILIMVSSHSK